MQEMQSFEYAIIRLVPQVEREEFLNVGVILYCHPVKFLGMKFTLNDHRLLTAFPAADIREVQLHLEAFEQICMADQKAGPIASLDMPSRFRWLTAKRSTIVQTSAVHPGLCLEPADTLIKLHRQLVLSE